MLNSLIDFIFSLSVESAFLFAGVIIISFSILYLISFLRHYKLSKFEQLTKYLIKNKKYKEALEEIENYIKKKVELTTYEEFITSSLSGDCHYQLQDFEKAREFYHSAANKSFKNNRIRINFLLKEAECFEKLNKIDDAISVYKIILTIDDNEFDTLYRISKLYYQKKDYKTTENYLKRLLTKKPNLLEPRILYMKLLYDMGFYEHALKHSKILKRHDPQNFEIYLYRVNILEQLRHYSEAIEEINEILNKKEFNNIDINVIEELKVRNIHLCLKARKFEEGIELSEKYLSKPLSDKNRIEILYNYASLLWNTGEEYKAIKNYEKVYQINKKYKDIELIYEHYKRFMPYYKLGYYFISTSSKYNKDFDLICRFLIGNNKYQCIYNSSDFFIYSDKISYIVFYRHIALLSYSKMTDLEIIISDWTKQPQNLEIYAILGCDEETKNHPFAKRAYIVKEEEFIKSIENLT